MARPRTRTEPSAPKVLGKTLQVLEAFDTDAPSWSETELRTRLAIPSSTLNRLLRGLEQAGYLLRTQDGHYRLGIAAVRLGRRAEASLNLPSVLDGQLRALAAETGELVILAVPELSSGLARYIATADSAQRLRVTATVGTAVPLTAGATAKTLLAFAPQSQIDHVLRHPRHRLAAGTMISARALRAQLAEIAQRGWGLSWEETYDGAWAVAAPVRGDDGHAFASIGVAAPISRHSAAREAANRRAVMAASATAAATLAAVPATVPRPARGHGANQSR